MRSGKGKLVDVLSSLQLWGEKPVVVFFLAATGEGAHVSNSEKTQETRFFVLFFLKRKEKLVNEWWETLKWESVFPHLTNGLPPRLVSAHSPSPRSRPHTSKSPITLFCAPFFDFAPCGAAPHACALRLCACVSWWRWVSRHFQGHAAQRRAGRSGPLGLSHDWREGFQPAADHLQGE